MLQASKFYIFWLDNRDNLYYGISKILKKVSQREEKKNQKDAIISKASMGKARVRITQI